MHLLVVEAVRRRVDEALAVDQRDAAPRVEQRLEVGRAPSFAARARSLARRSAAWRALLGEELRSSSSNIAQDRGLARLGDQRVDALGRLLDLHRGSRRGAPSRCRWR